MPWQHKVQHAAISAAQSLPASPLCPAPAHCQTRDMKQMPWAIVGTPLVSLAMYLMLAFALVMMTTPNPKAALPWNPALGPDAPGQGVPFGPYAGVSWPNLDTCNGPQVTFTISYVDLQGAHVLLGWGFGAATTPCVLSVRLMRAPGLVAGPNQHRMPHLQA